MKNYTVKKYQENDYEIWNAFIGQAKNATFLFHRDFMEYHKDRFEDFSLVIFEDEKLNCCFARQYKWKIGLFASRAYIWRIGLLMLN